MKRVIALFLVAIVLIMATACSTGNPDASSDTPKPGASDKRGDKIVYICYELGDMSFNDSGKRGIDELESKGYSVQTIETGYDVAKLESLIREISENKEVGYLVCCSNFQEYVETMAPQYPDMRYVLFDVSPETEIAAENIQYITFAQNEGSYLVGVVAAAMSKSGVVGAVGGTESPTVCDFIVGYIDGARAYNPDVKVVTAWIGDWTNSAKCLELCTMQYNTYGADVFFPIAAGAGTGAFEAAMNNGDGLWAIGVDSDQHEVFMSSGNEKMANVILTSMVKNIDKTIVSIFEEQKAGKEHWGELRVLGVKEGAVGYANNEFFAANVSADVMKAVKTAEEKIINGEIDVKSFFDFENGAADYNDYVASVAP